MPAMWLLLVASLTLGAAQSASSAPPVVQIPRLSRPPELTDFLGTAPPDGLLRVSDFRQREPGDGVPASQPTTAYLAYDDDNLYLVFVCRDAPGQVRAHMARREVLSGDDVVGVVLDTFGNRQRAYIFLTNPLGIQLDGVTAEGQDDDMTFDTLWHSEGRLTSDGYVVRIAIPFKSLRFTSVPRQTWTIALARIITRNNETSFWPYVTRRVASFTQQLATLEGLEGISPGRNLQFIPYATFTSARFLDEERASHVSDTRGRAGLDAKLVIRDAVTVDVAVNPDFSQVESDEPQVTVNQRFEVFFPEKRPFFIENASFFQTQETLSFSRRIADPQFGVRVTGKAGPWAFAGLGIDDQAPGHRLDERDPHHGDRAAIGVARLQREFANQSSLGVLVTRRDFASSSNDVASLDARLRLSQNWFLLAQAATSRTTGLDGTAQAGPAYRAELSYNDRRVAYSGVYLDRSPGFQTDLGFIPRVDMRQVQQKVRYNWFPNHRTIIRVGPSVDTLANWDHRGVMQDWQVEPVINLELRGQTEVGMGRSESMERFGGAPFRKHTTGFWFETAWFDWLTLDSFYERGTRINFFPAIGLDPFLAAWRHGRLSVTLRPSSRLRVEEAYLFSRLTTRDGDVLPEGTSPGGIFDNHIVRSRVDYQFTRDLSVRAILDYNAVLPNRSLVALDPTKRFTADLLLTYLVNPWTAIYAGYTDTYENVILGGVAPGFSRTGGPSMSTGRQVFVKVGYLVRR